MLREVLAQAWQMKGGARRVNPSGPDAFSGLHDRRVDRAEKAPSRFPDGINQVRQARMLERAPPKRSGLSISGDVPKAA